MTNGSRWLPGQRYPNPRRFGPPPSDPLDRFAEKVALADAGCWEWIGHCFTATGYGSFYDSRAKRGTVAHRWAYEHFVGPIPEGLQLDHLCRNRACVNPAHLEPVTHAENGRRGARGALYVPPTTCRNGHPKQGRGRCETCLRASQRRRTARYRARMREA